MPVNQRHLCGVQSAVINTDHLHHRQCAYPLSLLTYLARLAWHAEMLCVLQMLLSFIFFFNGPLGDQLSQNVLDRSSQNIHDSYLCVMA